MGEYTNLSDEKVAKIADEFYAARESKTIPQNQPTITVVAAQPGAGKSAAATL
ncbi:hypothetical protein AGMMS50229_04480 [Campylobacterota bacterium]|nr:hypothetical protein AGMMS50229_04480 [Campylobacterota bacterium]